MRLRVRNPNRPGPHNCNADALLRNPIILEGEDNPECPRVNLYELAAKQEEEDNYNEYDLPKIRYVTDQRKETDSKQMYRTKMPMKGLLRAPKISVTREKKNCRI